MATEQENSPLDTLTDHVRAALIAAAPGPSEVTDAAAQATYGFLFPALEGCEDEAAAAAAAAAGTLLATKKLSSAPIWHVSRGAAVGIMHAGFGRRLDLEPMLIAAVRRMMTEADGLGGDFGAAAQGAIEGSITAADELGLDPQDFAATTALAALEMSEELPEGALEKIQHLVNRRILGVDVRIPSRYTLELPS